MISKLTAFSHSASRALLSGLVLLSLSGQVWAVPYLSGDLKFSTAGQSMWGPDGGLTISKTAFFGPTWSQSSSTLGKIYGSVSSTSVRNPLWTTWKACKDYLNYLCGDAPTKNYTVTVDTRTGAKITTTLNAGKVGLEAGFTLDSGSVNATAKFSADATLPDAALNPGDQINFNASSLFSSGTIKTQSPKVEATLKGVADVSGKIDAKGCLLALGCVSGSVDIGSPGVKKADLITVDLAKVDWFGGLAETKFLKEQITLNGNLTTKALKLATSKTVLYVSTPPPGPLAVELGNIQLDLPDAAGTGSNADDKLVANSRNKIVDFNVDFDGLLAFSGATAPLGLKFSKKFGTVGGKDFKIAVSGDLIDMDAGPTVDFFQDFELDPTLNVKLDFSSSVLIGSNATPVWSYEGEWASLPDMTFFETTTVTPTWSLTSMLKNTTGFDFGLEVTVDILKGGIRALIADVEIIKGALGPLVSIPFATGRFLPINIFDQDAFAFGDYNSILGDAFTIFVDAPGVGSNKSATGVPETGSILIFATGLFVLGTLRRRRRSRRSALYGV